MRMRSLDAIIVAFAVFLVGGGIYAYMDKHHIMSLMGGIFGGVLEIGFLVYTSKNPRVGRIGSAATALFMALSFVMAAMSQMKKGIDPTFGWMGVAVSLGVFLALGAGHMISMKRKSA